MSKVIINNNVELNEINLNVRKEIKKSIEIKEKQINNLHILLEKTGENIMPNAIKGDEK